MTSYVWKFPFERMARSDLFSAEFISIPTEMNVDPTMLIGRRIWLVANMGPDRDYLYGHLVVDEISIIEEGVNRGHFILSTARLLSFRILPHDRDHFHRWQLPQTLSLVGISEIADSTQNLFIDIIFRNEIRSFNPPNPTKIRSVKIPKSSSPRFLGRELYCSILSQFALGDLERWGKNTEWSPFAVLAVLKCQDMGILGASVNEVLRLDTFLLSCIGTTTEILLPTPSAFFSDTPIVDTMLTSLEPDNIVARRFLRPSNCDKNIQSLSRLQAAELRHQEILRDIASFLVSNSIQIFMSRSLDIALWLRDGLFLGEIKSATPANFVSQAEHGIIQLLKYEMAFEDDGFPVGVKALIVEAAASEATVDYMRKLARKGGVKIFIYDGMVSWPNRVIGILELLTMGDSRLPK